MFEISLLGSRHLENSEDARKTYSFSKWYMLFKKVYFIYKNFTFNGDHEDMHEIGKLLAVTFNKHWYPRAVVDTSNNKIEIRCMEILVKNKFMWPEKDGCWLKNGDIISSIEPPTPVSQRAFGLCREDFTKLKGLILSIFWRYMNRDNKSVS